MISFKESNINLNDIKYGEVGHMIFYVKDAGYIYIRNFSDWRYKSWMKLNGIELNGD